MFYTLRKVVIVIFWAILVAFGWFIYEQREFFQPAVNLITVATQLHYTTQASAPLAEISGQVVQVTGPDTFKVRTTNDVTFHLRLTGMELPPPKGPADYLTRNYLAGVKTNLTSLILSNQVRVALTYTNENRAGLGVVYSDGTCINLKLVETGMTTANRNFLKTLPLAEQYAYLTAQTKAKRQRLGGWKYMPPDS
ncbi:MAG: thermonuclease family protein [Verrucomicrobia bacterium]|nr:thermonuclease family protein [Verrucomicrobiota bacterium]